MLTMTPRCKCQQGCHNTDVMTSAIMATSCGSSTAVTHQQCISSYPSTALLQVIPAMIPVSHCQQCNYNINTWCWQQLWLHAKHLNTSHMNSRYVTIHSYLFFRLCWHPMPWFKKWCHTANVIVLKWWRHHANHQNKSHINTAKWLLIDSHFFRQWYQNC